VLVSRSPKARAPARVCRNLPRWRFGLSDTCLAKFPGPQPLVEHSCIDVSRTTIHLREIAARVQAPAENGRQPPTFHSRIAKNCNGMLPATRHEALALTMANTESCT
jgi:hypothetical protein